MMRPGQAPILIAICGNALASDDALGSEVASCLKQQEHGHVDLTILGTDTTALLDAIGGRHALLLIDAILCPGIEAGQLIDVRWDRRNHLETGKVRATARPGGQEIVLVPVSQRAVSSHGLGVMDQLALAARLGLAPPIVRLIGVTAASFTVGAAMSPQVRNQLPRLVARVVKWCRHLGRRSMMADVSHEKEYLPCC